MTRGQPRPLCIAPMVDRTDRAFRVVMRAITRRTLLYTEMIPVGAVLGPRSDRVLAFDPVERPLALQLGGNDPATLARAARLAAARGYDEIDLNCGCPSARVGSGGFGVVLMAEPERVAACVEAMAAAALRPITVKHRLGFDALDRYEDVARFVQRVARAGAARFIVHARKAILGRLSPRQNRQVPPLRPQWVHRLKADFPRLKIELNGGITSLSEAFTHLDAGLDGVMIGRAAFEDPMIFADADPWLEAWHRGEARPAARVVGAGERIAMVRSLRPIVDRWLEGGGRLCEIVRPMLGLAHGIPGARRFRADLVEGARAPTAGVEVFDQALCALATVGREVGAVRRGSGGQKRTGSPLET
ncbi:MAG: tRNA dihydrouridine(20/20a) synthase DusA [Myxococcota bacterium]